MNLWIYMFKLPECKEGDLGDSIPRKELPSERDKEREREIVGMVSREILSFDLKCN